MTYCEERNYDNEKDEEFYGPAAGSGDDHEFGGLWQQDQRGNQDRRGNRMLRADD